MKCFVSQDFDANMSIQEALDIISKWNGRVIDFNPRGPGGGNPCISIAFDHKISALNFLTEMAPRGESQEFLESLIKPLLS